MATLLDTALNAASVARESASDDRTDRRNAVAANTSTAEDANLRLNLGLSTGAHRALTYAFDKLEEVSVV